MSKKLLLSGIVFSFLLCGAPMTRASVETKNLIIKDLTGKIPPQRFQELVSKVESTFRGILGFWSAKPRTDRFGKIIVEFDRHLPKSSASVFFWQKADGRRVRVVKVFGDDENPMMLAHRLTTAVFPSRDNLVRNMMGAISEARFGNPLSFPRCGFSPDEWVMALVKTGSYIPLGDLGPKPKDWGVEIVNHKLRIIDRARLHAAYLEAASFGEFLIGTYGTGVMKQFARPEGNMSRSQSNAKYRPQLKNRPRRLGNHAKRPWKQTFGIGLGQLENRWLENIELRSGDKEGHIPLLIKLWKKGPGPACFSAQELARKRQ